MKKIITILFLTIIALVFPQYTRAGSFTTSLTRAQQYYEGLYKDLGDNGGVINEYYSSPKSVYTIRHGTIGGIFYFDYIHDATKAAQLRRFVAKYRFYPNNDLHSFIWNTRIKQSVDLYSFIPYHDCFVMLPVIGNELPYHSKVCKLGKLGMSFYINATKFDTLLPTIQELQNLEIGKPIDKNVVKDLESKYNRLGFGMPICLFNMCSNVASTIRTAEFGELELRLGNMHYADMVASELLKAQNDKGAIYFSYDKFGNLTNSKPFIYNLIDVVLSDSPVFKGFIPTNAETMNDALAFLLHYRCKKYNICQ